MCQVHTINYLVGHKFSSTGNPEEDQDLTTAFTSLSLVLSPASILALHLSVDASAPLAPALVLDSGERLVSSSPDRVKELSCQLYSTLIIQAMWLEILCILYCWVFIINRDTNLKDETTFGRREKFKSYWRDKDVNWTIELGSFSFWKAFMRAETHQISRVYIISHYVFWAPWYSCDIIKKNWYDMLICYSPTKLAVICCLVYYLPTGKRTTLHPEFPYKEKSFNSPICKKHVETSEDIAYVHCVRYLAATSSMRQVFFLTIIKK